MQPYVQPPYPARMPAAQQAPAQPPALPPGTILFDRYLIQGYIGGGGFGHIYKALDNAFGFRRAIKEAFYQDPLTRRQFHLESEFLLNIRHPNLVRGYAVFEQCGRLYLVMDYVDGHTLEEIAIDHIRRTGTPLSEARVLDWVIPMCGALHALHTSPVPVIHRDIKPANIKVNRQGIPILIDLGLAKLYAPGTKTIGAALAFTPGYAPPEQYQATGTTDARTDVYGMGASLFYLLTGYQPTEAPARIGTLAAPPLRQLSPTISPLTEKAVLRAMELLPERRQQAVLELELDLRTARAALETAHMPAAWPSNGFAEIVCPRCGGQNPHGASHCMHCGMALLARPTRPLGENQASSPHEIAGVDPAQPAVSQGDAVSLALEAGASVEQQQQSGQDSARAEPDMHSAPADAEPVGVGDTGEDAHGLAPGADGGESGSWGTVEDAPLLSAARNGSVSAASDTDEDGIVDFASLSLGPVSEPDQPAIVMPPMRRGPAPVAMPLPPADPPDLVVRSASPVHGPARGEPLWHQAARYEGGGAPAPLGGSRAGASFQNGARQRSAREARPLSANRAALVWTARERLQRALPSIQRWHAETIAATVPQDETEVRSTLAALMALVFAFGTLVAVQYWPAILAALPALALGHWCRMSKSAQPVPEARWLATLALIVTYVWLALYTLGVIILALHRG